MQYRPRNRRRRRNRHVRWGRLLAVLAGLTIAVFGLIKLVGYGIDLLSSGRTAQELREIYYAAPNEPIAETEMPVYEPMTVPEETPVPTSESAVTANPTQSPIPHLPSAAYQNNPKLQINNRFKYLRKESKYIVGWLNIERLIDEPVVQRDDVFFLNHDVKGNQNVNGAVFLDSGVSLKSRPYTYILYGHNMKSGAMFGCLRNYEKVSFYHSAPFITFDTMYEDGGYVIFAVGNISTEKVNRNYVDFYALKSTNIEGRKNAINALLSASVHTCTVDVQPEDQLLILVTCVEKDEERRVIAARRIRDGEDTNELRKQVEQSRLR